MYRGDGELPSDTYSWYCGWSEIEPFWKELVPSRSSKMLVPGIGNDSMIVDLWDTGWRQIDAFDFSADALVRAQKLFGDRQLELICGN